MQPTLHISTGVEYFLDPSKTSGARYHKVTTSCVYDRTGIPKALARPKSASCINIKQRKSVSTCLSHRTNTCQTYFLSQVPLIVLLDLSIDWVASNLDATHGDDDNMQLQSIADTKNFSKSVCLDQNRKHPNTF